MPFFEIHCRAEQARSHSLEDFSKGLSAMERRVFPKAMSRTINDVAGKAKTKTMRMLSLKMGIKKKHLNKRYFDLKKSTTKTLEFTWTGRSKPLPLSYFGGKPLKAGSDSTKSFHKRKGKPGYSAASLGVRRKYKFFGRTMESGHEGAFIRSRTATWRKSKTGKWGTYPITQRFGASVPVGMLQAAVWKTWGVETERLRERFDKNLSFYVSKLK